LTIDASLTGEMATHIMAAVLNALILHGQHEANQGSLLSLGAQVYELLRPSFVEVFAVSNFIIFNLLLHLKNVLLYCNFFVKS